MNTKTKLTLVAALILGAVSLNAEKQESLGGTAQTKYTSDYSRRGDIVSTNAVQASLGFETSISNLDVFGDFFTNQSTESEVDSDEFTIGVGTRFIDGLVGTSVGLYNTDFSDSDNSLEYFLSVDLNTILSPRLSFFDDVDEDLQTFEGEISYDIDLSVADLSLGGVLGSTDNVTAQNQTYTGVSASLSKDVSEEFNIFTDVSFSDSESRDYETIWGVGLNLNF